MPVSATTVTQYYTGIFRQAPSTAVSTAYQSMANDAAALQSMLSAANVTVDPVVRLYQTAFNRLPDNAGMTAWVSAFSTGAITLQAIANGFTTSTEFTNLYPASMSNSQFVGALYWNILQRAGEDAGITGWVNALNSGALTRAQVLLGFSDSGEFKAKIEPAVNSFLTNIANTAVASQGNAALYAGTLFDQAGAPVTTYNLTTGIDTITPVANSVINGILGSTINTFDSIVAAGINDTFNISDTTATTFAMPASITLSGLTAVNVARNSTGVNTGAVIISDSTFGTGIKNLTYVDASVAANMTGATFAATLGSATSVSFAATGTGTFTTGAVTDSSTAGTLSTISVTKTTGALTLTGNAITTLNLNAVGGVATVAAAAGTRALTVNVSGATGSGVTDATATTATINSSVTAAGAVGTYTTAAATTVNYNTTTANGAGAATITAAAATTLNVGGSAVATLTLTGSTALTTVNVSGTGGLAADLTAAATAVTALNFTNTAGTSTVTVNLATAVTGGAGTESITVGAGTKAINLGSGNDTLTLTGAALGTGGTAVGGDGIDTLSMTTANAATASATATLAAAVTGFERLLLTTSAASTIDLAALGGYNYVTIANGANTLTLNNMASGGTVVIGGANTGVTFGGTMGSGTNDTVNVVLNNSTAALVAFGTITAPNVENIVISVNDTQATPTPLVNTLNTLTITDAGMRSLVISGTDGLAITLGAAATGLQTFDASGITSGVATGNAANLGVTFTASALQYASTALGTLRGGDTLDFSAALAAVNITVTAGANTITGSSTIGSTLTGGTGADVIVGGAGNDTISVGASAAAVTNTVTSGAGADSVVLTGSLGVDTLIYGANNTAASATGLNVDTITDFTSGTDKIQLTANAGGAAANTLGFVTAAGNTFAAMATPIADAVSVATLANVYTQLASDLVAANFAASAAGAGSLVARVVTFANGAAAGTYVVLNDNVAGFQAATDVVIKLAGTTTTIAAGDFTVV